MISLNTNHGPEFETCGSIFMGSKRYIDDCKIALYGVPYDGTTSFRPGTRFGPNAIKNVSNGIESFCPQLNLDLEDINFADIGNLKVPYGSPKPVIKEVNKATEFLISHKIKPVMLGGEHSLTIGAIEVLSNTFPELLLLQLDAHADLREEWLGEKYSHACTMRRCLEVLPSKRLLQLAIRSGTRDEFNEINQERRLIPHSKFQAASHLEKALTPHVGKPIYLTVDLDWFDPSVMPGTGTPEPGGFFWDDFAAVINVLKKHQLIGADIVELAPDLDTSGSSSVFAAKVTRSVLMLLSLS